MKIGPEDALQMRLVAILREHARSDVLFYHCPNGERRDPATAKKLKLMGVLPGVADLTIIADGEVHFLELKEGKGRMSSDQDRFMQSCQRARANYRCATGFAEAIEAINAMGVCRTRLTIPEVPELSDARSAAGMRKGEGLSSPSP